MAYNTEDLEAKALAAIEAEKLVFLNEVACYLPCSEKTFYNHKLHKSPKILSLISKGFVEKKQPPKIQKKGLSETQISKGYVYIIKCEGFSYYKIGISKINPKARLASLQTGCPFILELIDTIPSSRYKKIEQELHVNFREKRVLGEWFELQDFEISEAVKYCKKDLSPLTLF